MKNTGGRFGGAITAALILEEFVDEIAWVHLDIAGPARARSSSALNQRVALDLVLLVW